MSKRKKDMNERGQLERVIVNEKWFVIDGHTESKLESETKTGGFRIKEVHQ